MVQLCWMNSTANQASLFKIGGFLKITIKVPLKKKIINKSYESLTAILFMMNYLPKVYAIPQTPTSALPYPTCVIDLKALILIKRFLPLTIPTVPSHFPVFSSNLPHTLKLFKRITFNWYNPATLNTFFQMNCFLFSKCAQTPICSGFEFCLKSSWKGFQESAIFWPQPCWRLLDWNKQTDKTK